MLARSINENLNNFSDRLFDSSIDHSYLNSIENEFNQQHKDINVSKNEDDKTRSIFISNKLETLEIINLDDINVKNYITLNVTFKRSKVFILYYTIQKLYQQF